MSKFVCKGNCEMNKENYEAWNEKCAYSNGFCDAKFEEVSDLSEMSSRFWHYIFEGNWINSGDFTTDKLVCHMSDRDDINAVFDICKTMANRLCGASACVAWEYKKLPFEHEAFKWIAFGWGDPKVTNRYGYAYFDFDEEQVYIDADDMEERVISFQKAFKELYS
ncbi:MAG: hypothetical protein ACLR02_11210 [Clostridium sp.]